MYSSNGWGQTGSDSGLCCSCRFLSATYFMSIEFVHTCNRWRLLSICSLMCVTLQSYHHKLQTEMLLCCVSSRMCCRNPVKKFKGMEKTKQFGLSKNWCFFCLLPSMFLNTVRRRTVGRSYSGSGEPTAAPARTESSLKSWKLNVPFCSFIYVVC